MARLAIPRGKMLMTPRSRAEYAMKLSAAMWEIRSRTVAGLHENDAEFIDLAAIDAEVIAQTFVGDSIEFEAEAKYAEARARWEALRFDV